MLTIALKAVGKKGPDTGTEEMADEDETMASALGTSVIE